EGGRGRGGPQESRRDRGQRSRRLRRPGRGGQEGPALRRECAVRRRGCLTLTERSARVVAAVKLHRPIVRRREARFLAEGPNLVEAALRRGLVCEVFATESALERFGSLLNGT